MLYCTVKTSLLDPLIPTMNMHLVNLARAIIKHTRARELSRTRSRREFSVLFYHSIHIEMLALTHSVIERS